MTDLRGEQDYCWRSVRESRFSDISGGCWTLIGIFNACDLMRLLALVLYLIDPEKTFIK